MSKTTENYTYKLTPFSSCKVPNLILIFFITLLNLCSSLLMAITFIFLNNSYELQAPSLPMLIVIIPPTSP